MNIIINLIITILIIVLLTINIMFCLENKKLKKEIQNNNSRKEKQINRFIFVKIEDEIRLPELVSGKQLNKLN